MNCYSAGKLKQSPIIEISYHNYLKQLLFWAMCAGSCPLNEKRPFGLFCIQILSHYAKKPTKLDHYCLGRIWLKQPKTYVAQLKLYWVWPTKLGKITLTNAIMHKGHHNLANLFYLRGRGHSFLPENPNTTYNGKHLQKNRNIKISGKYFSSIC